MLASCDVEAEQFVKFYDADPERVYVVPLGVEHAFFAPGYRPQARRALGLDGVATLLLFVGRLQPSRASTSRLETLIELRARVATRCSPSSADRRGAMVATRSPSCTAACAEAGVIEHVSFVAPQAHQLLSTWMRAADVTLVPSRSESFGLVALESSACGTPVVASEVGGLMTLIEPGRERAARRRARPRGVGAGRGNGPRSRDHDVDV